MMKEAGGLYVRGCPILYEVYNKYVCVCGRRPIQDPLHVIYIVSGNIRYIWVVE